jgi:Sodium/hydrogen exchanger family
MAQLGIVLVAAMMLGYLAERLRLPPIVGQLMAGVVLGPTLFGAVLLHLYATLPEGLGETRVGRRLPVFLEPPEESAPSPQSEESTQVDLTSVGAPASRVDVVDAGFEGRPWHTCWAQCYGATVIAQPERSAPGYWPQPLRLWQASIREIVETVHDRLLATCGLDHERPHGPSGFRPRLDADCLQHDGLLYQRV